MVSFQTLRSWHRRASILQFMAFNYDYCVRYYEGICQEPAEAPNQTPSRKDSTLQALQAAPFPSPSGALIHSLLTNHAGHTEPYIGLRVGFRQVAGF